MPRGCLRPAGKEGIDKRLVDPRLRWFTVIGRGELPRREKERVADSQHRHRRGPVDGSDSTTDGDRGYFIGHIPRDFGPVMDLVESDVVSVCDTEGASRSYTVVDIFDVKVGTCWREIEECVGGYGESVVLQAC